MMQAFMMKALESGALDGLKKQSFDLPKFFNQELKSETIKDFKEADKSLFDPQKWDNGQEITPDINKLSCRNQELAGEKHPVTNVQFEQKIVVTSDGAYEVVTPKFEAKFEVQLPKELYVESDGKQFKECNTQLKNAIENDSELSSKFDDEQLEQIMDGDTPDGYVWHHDCEEGKMQLVDYETHQKTGHTGGRKIWGGGTENR